jgi:ABC-type glycerol-3-phosphate transport system substrate-binding protein
MAWRFIRYMTSPEVESQLYAQLRRNCPTRKSVAYSKEFLDGTLEPHHPEVFVRAVERSREMPITNRWSLWTTQFNSEMDDLFSGRQRNASVCLKKATHAADAALAEEEGF